MVQPSPQLCIAAHSTLAPDDLLSTAEAEVWQGLLRSAARLLEAYQGLVEEGPANEGRIIRRRLARQAREALLAGDRATFFQCASDLREETQLLSGSSHGVPQVNANIEGQGARAAGGDA